MDEFLDSVWAKIMDFIEAIAACLDVLLAPIHQHLGPATAILIIVVVVVAFTKWFARIYTTKRHLELKAEYEHWYELRQEAMHCEDREKGKILARNIDQGQLNKAYYDYFFEGFLKSIITTILPILFAVAYVNRAYGPDKLTKLIGRKTLYAFSRSSGDPVLVSSFFWFIICLLLVYLAWFIMGKLISHFRHAKKQAT
jgi:uncharacterized membrane protein (DUF106 family)